MDLQALERAKQQWQSAADAMPQLICLLNADGRLIHVNRTIEWWGMGAVADVRGRELHDLLHPGCDDPRCYFRRLWRQSAPARRNGRRSEHEAYDGRLQRHFVIRIQPLVSRRSGEAFDDDGLHSVVVVDDVSELREAEADIRRRNDELSQQVVQEAKRRSLSEDMQARLQDILEKTTDIIAIADPAGNLLYVNRAAREMLGVGEDDDLGGRKLCEQADPDVIDTLRTVAIPAAIEDGLWTGESRMRDHEGREFHASQVITAHRRENGDLDCIATVLRDISERVNSERALRASREELRQLSAMLVSIQEDERRRIALDLHDGLGQSLSLIKLAVEKSVALLRDGEPQAALDTLDHLVPLAKAAVQDVRRVATELRPSILDDLGILATLSWFFREFQAVCSHIEVEKSLAVTEQDVPETLKITLYRIIQEATSNIVKHAGADRVRVSLHRDDSALHLQIEDNGCGFVPEALCAHCRTCNTESCSGLGLVGMKERVSLSGGVYRLVSSPGFGTRVEASWPLVAAPVQPLRSNTLA
jgi:PAS domain S-box-containing protein